MDPASVLAIVNGSIDLALKCASVVKSLHDVASKHKYAELFLVSMIDECQTFHLAWGRIQSWAQIRQESTSTVDDQLVERLCSSLATGTMVLSALEQDLVNLGSAATPTEFLGFRRRNKTIWNEQVFRDHQDRLRGQIGAMTLLLGVVNLYVFLFARITVGVVSSLAIACTWVSTDPRLAQHQWSKPISSRKKSTCSKPPTKLRGPL